MIELIKCLPSKATIGGGAEDDGVDSIHGGLGWEGGSDKA